MSVPGGVSTVCELACTGQGGEALPSPLRDPLFLTCARAVSPRPAFGVCRLTSATPHLVYGLQYMVQADMVRGCELEGSEDGWIDD